MPGLAAYVRERRQELGLTQEQLGERLGWAQERISLLEHARYGMPSLPLLARLSAALEVPLTRVLEAAGYGAAARASHASSDETAPSIQPALTITLQRLLAIDAVTLKDALNQASDLMAEALGAEKVDAFLYEEETATLVALGTSNTAMGRKEQRVGLNRIPLANGGRQVEVFLTGDEYYTGHADDDPEVESGLVRTLGVRSIFAVPLWVEGRIRGILAAESAHPDRFGEAERAFFRAAGRWVGMIAHRAELHEAITRQSIEEARRAAADEMVTVVAHDLANQITPIKGRIDLLLRRARREEDEKYAVDAEAASSALGRLQRFVSDLLDAARLEGGIFSLNLQPCNLVELLLQEVDVVHATRPEIEVRAPQELMVMADPSKLGQVLGNLIGNAVQHTPAGTLVLIAAGGARHDDRDWARVDIHDEGPGIAPELLPRLFARGASGGASNGLGLGLYLARGITEAHGGTLTVESEAGAGTTFHLELPAASEL